MRQPHFGKLYSMVFFFVLWKGGYSESKKILSFERVKLNQTVSRPYSNLTGMTTLLTCKVQCYHDVRCVAFAFHPERKECLLYDRNINQSTKLIVDENVRSFILDLDWTNQAENKPTFSSSSGTGHQSQVVDGDIRPQDFGSSFKCFQTREHDLYPWLIIDLIEEFLVQFIYVYNADDYPERLHDVNYELYQENPAINSSAVPNCCASVPHFTLGRNIIRCNRGVSGRFLKISIEKSQFLTLCEVKVYGEKANECCRYDCNNQRHYTCYRPPVGDNIAINKPAIQSSRFSTFYARYGNDGIFATYREQCTHTDHRDTTPYWQVDLQSQYNITSVTIANRVDGKQNLGHRLSDVTIATYTEDPLKGGTPTVCRFLPGEFGCTIRTFECDQVTVGRWLRISKPTEYLTLCEVQVTGNEI